VVLQRHFSDGPVWQWLSRCRAICFFFLEPPLMRGHGGRFGRRLYESVIVGGRRILDFDLPLSSGVV